MYLRGAVVLQGLPYGPCKGTMTGFYRILSILVLGVYGLRLRFVRLPIHDGYIQYGTFIYRTRNHRILIITALSKVTLLITPVTVNFLRLRMPRGPETPQLLRPTREYNIP